MITKKIIADKLLAYLQHHLSPADLVDWCENSLLNGDSEDDKFHTVRNCLAQPGLADAKAFGVEWQDCETIMNKLGFTWEVKASSVA